MITVILKDGTEVSVGDGNELVPYSPNGKFDVMVAVYRRAERYWTMDRLSTLRVGDFFRKLDVPDSKDTAFLVTKAPYVSPNRSYPGSPTIHLEGLTLVQLSSLPEPVAYRLLSAPLSAAPVLTTHNRLLLETDIKS